MERKIALGEFKRIHRSYIIPLHKIKSLRNRKVTIDATELPVSNSYLASLAEWIKNR